MEHTRLGGLARAKSLSASRRSTIARKAARARWRSNRGILTREEIRRQIVAALVDRSAIAYLFGSYARGEATSKSDVDLLVVEPNLESGWLKETAVIRRRLDFNRPVDVVVMDSASFEKWRGEVGSLPYEVSSEGVRLV